MPPVQSNPFGLVSSVAFSCDGTMIASASWCCIKLWDANTGTMLFQLRTSCGSDGPKNMTFSQDGSFIYSWIKNDVYIWSLISTKETGGEEVISDIYLSSCFRPGIVVNEEGWLVDPKTMRTISQLPSTLRSQLLAFGSNHESLAIGTQDGHVYVMNFPAEAIQSPETRPIEKTSRLYPLKGGMDQVAYNINKDSDSGGDSDSGSESEFSELNRHLVHEVFVFDVT